jgi:hypothetical protein
MIVELPNLDVVTVDFEYLKEERKRTLHLSHDMSLNKVEWVTKTICTVTVGEAKAVHHVWHTASTKFNFPKKKERARVLGDTLCLLFPSAIPGNKDLRREIWAALYGKGFHRFPVGNVDRLSRMLAKASKRLIKRDEKGK